MKSHRLFLAAIVLGTSLTAGSVQADELNDFVGGITARDLVFAEFDGVVMENDLQNRQLVVLEKTIQLVDDDIGGYRLRTIVRNRFGTPIRPELILQGSRVFVRGISNRDGSVLAREIYELGPGVRVDRLKREIPEWRPDKDPEERP